MSSSGFNQDLPLVERVVEGEGVQTVHTHSPRKQEWSQKTILRLVYTILGILVAFAAIWSRTYSKDQENQIIKLQIQAGMAGVESIPSIPSSDPIPQVFGTEPAAVAQSHKWCVDIPAGFKGWKYIKIPKNFNPDSVRMLNMEFVALDVMSEADMKNPHGSGMSYQVELGQKSVDLWLEKAVKARGIGYFGFYTNGVKTSDAQVCGNV